MEPRKQLVWKDEYSVQVAELDNQHKFLFNVINELINGISVETSKEDINGIITKLLAYKNSHFATEEKYFELFNYEGAKEHKEAHALFAENVMQISKKNGEDTLELAFELVDFLEDWLVNHILTMDHKYIECFKAHSLK